MSRITTLTDLNNQTYIERDIHVKEVNKYKSALQTLGVKYEDVSKKWILEKKVSEGRQKQIDQLITLVEKFDQNDIKKIKIDNTTDDTELTKVWMKEFNITKKEYDDYVSPQLSRGKNFLSKYI